MKRTFGVLLVFGWVGVILYSSYRIEKGFTDIGMGFIQFVKWIASRLFISAEWELGWLEGALQKILHIEAFILLGFFASISLLWWGVNGRRRLLMVGILAVSIALVDEGFQVFALHGQFNALDLIWDGLGAFIGYEIHRFVVYSNR